jgi:hypothetical protein
MARFPRTEPAIAALAIVVRDGLMREAEDFPTPPVPPEELQTRLDAHNTVKTAAVSAQSSAREQHALKDDALEALVDALKANLRYAEVAVRDQPEKLNELGWGTPRTGKGFDVPGQVRDISMVAQGPGWLLLDYESQRQSCGIPGREDHRSDGRGRRATPGRHFDVRPPAEAQRAVRTPHGALTLTPYLRTGFILAAWTVLPSGN